MKNTAEQITKKYSDILRVNRKSISVRGALRIGEAKAIHYELTEAGYRGIGKLQFSNGEHCYRRYVPA